MSLVRAQVCKSNKRYWFDTAFIALRCFSIILGRCCVLLPTHTLGSDKNLGGVCDCSRHCRAHFRSSQRNLGGNHRCEQDTARRVWICSKQFKPRHGSLFRAAMHSFTVLFRIFGSLHLQILDILFDLGTWSYCLAQCLLSR